MGGGDEGSLVPRSYIRNTLPRFIFFKFHIVRKEGYEGRNDGQGTQYNE